MTCIVAVEGKLGKYNVKIEVFIMHLRIAILATRVWALWDGYVTIYLLQRTFLTLTPQKQGKSRHFMCKTVPTERADYPGSPTIWFDRRNGCHEFYLGNNLKSFAWYASTRVLSSPEYLLNHF